MAPAAVHGSSGGGNFALCLLVRQPEVVHGAVLHEPVSGRLFDDPEAARRALTELVRRGIEAGGPAGAQQRLFRWVAGTPTGIGSSPTFGSGCGQRPIPSSEIELGSYEGFPPDDATLEAIAAPVMVLVGTQTHAVYAQAAGRLAERLGVEVTSMPGRAIWPITDHPHELAQTVRSFLRQLAECSDGGN